MKVVSICSGKGGVGKSCVASSVIQELLVQGFRVGAIDADYSNPNLGRFLRIKEDISVAEDKRLVPAKTKDGISFFSIEKIVGDKGVSMRGIQYSRLTRDIIDGGVWDVDYLVVDLPAVIGDEFKTVLSACAENYLGSILVVQPAHIETAERAIKTHLINGVPILGVIENMAWFVCEDGKKYFLFGEGKTEDLCAKYELPFVGRIPFDLLIQQQLTSGERVRLPDKEIIRTITKAVIDAKPEELGFLQELKQTIRSGMMKTVFTVVVHGVRLINQFINIGELQAKHNYYQKMTISLQIYSQEKWKLRKDMQEKGSLEPLPSPDYVINYRVENGKLMVVKDPKTANIVLRTTESTPVWLAIGKKKFPNGREIAYTIWDAVGNGDIETDGVMSNILGIAFLKDLWDQSYQIVAPKIAPLIAPLVS